MGKGSKKAKMEVVQYYMSLHFGVCHGPVDAFLGVTIDQKSAWSGSIGTGSVTVNNEELFGGIKKEGGISGVITFLAGASNQVMPDFLASRLGRSSSTCPAFRGTATVFFTGNSERGFYWRANSPYLPGTWIKVRRIPKVLNQAIANIGGNANPAHIIYEAMTNTDWGMGAPSTAFNVASFEAAAQTLYDEGFGLSLGWFEQGAIETFISEIIDHIEAVLFVDPETGLFTLKLIRNDYDPDSLPIITPDNADLTNFQRKLWAETVNEIVVTWTNPENEEEETVSMQDPANIAMQGGLVSDSRHYYGVRSSDLAMKLATRDLRVASSPLASCEAVVNRKLFRIKPGDVVKLTWPEWGINEAIMRVGPVDYGKPGDSTIKVSLMEDVFSYTTSAYLTPPDTEWQDESEDPQPLTFSHIFTLPYFFVVNLIDDAALLANVDYPDALAGILGAQNGQDTNQFEVFGVASTDPLGNPVVESLGTLDIAARALIDVPLAFEPESANIPLVNMTQGTGPVVGGFALIGSGSDAECELAVVSAWEGSKLSLVRGVLDTVPREWPQGTPIWFLNDNMSFIDETIRSAGEVVEYYPCPWTSRGMLSRNDAIKISATLNERPWLPFRPANVKLNGITHGEVDLTGVAQPLVEWVNRNRLSEDALIMRWTDGDTAPEEGQTTTITVMDRDRNVLSTIDEIVGTSHAFTMAELLNLSPQGIIRVTSKRDGLESLTGMEFLYLIASTPFVTAYTVTNFTQTTSQTVTIPPETQEGDILIAYVMHRGTLTIPDGWSLVHLVETFNDTPHHLSVLKCRATADGVGTSAGENVTFTQTDVSSIRLAIEMLVIRSPYIAQIVDSATGSIDGTGTNTFSIPEVTATDLQLAVTGGTSLLASTKAPNTFELSSGWNQTTPKTSNDTTNQIRLGVGYRVLQENETSDGTFSINTSDTQNQWAAVTLLIGRNPLPELPELPKKELLKYWFKAGVGAYKGDGYFDLAEDGDPVSLWENLGNQENARQRTLARRPIYRTGGLNGKPYIECDATDQQFFEDLLGLEQPSGIFSARPWTVIVVTDGIDVNAYPGILGSTVSNGGKVGLYFRPPANEQINFMKSSWRVGNVVNPQILFVGNRRYLNPETADTYTDACDLFYYRINGVSDRNTSSSGLTATAISQVQFLHNAGLTEGGYFHGHLYEIMIYDGVVPRSQWAAIEDYLKAEYGFEFTSGPFE